MEWQEKLKEYCDEQGKLWSDYKLEVGKEIKAMKESGGQLAPETKAKIDKMEVDFGSLESKITEAREEVKKEQETKDAEYKKQFTALEAKLNRPRAGVSDGLERKDFVVPELYRMASEEKAMDMHEATFKTMRTPMKVTTEEKALTLNDPETGGYLAPPEFLNTIIKELREITPAMQIANVRTTSRTSIVMAKKTGTVAAKRRGESEPKTESTGLTYATETVNLEEMYAFIDVTEMDLEDSMFNLEGEIREEMIDAFNAKIGLEFISGTGPLAMEGILTNADVGEQNSGAAGDLTPNGLIDFVVAGLKAQFQTRATLGFNLSTLSKIRQLEDTAGSYIWAPGFGTTPNSILGKQYWISEDMPNVEAGLYPIVYGDFKRAYQIGLRIRMAIKKITDSILDEAGLIRFSGRMRIGGRVVQAVAMKKLKIAADA